MNGRIVALVGLSVLAVTTAALGGHVVAGARSGQQQAVPSAASITRCLEGGQDPSSETVTRCLTRALQDVTAAVGVAAADQQLDAAIRADARLARACHDAAHVAGAAAYTGHAQVDEALRALRSGTCMTGMMHGLLDAVAASGLPRSEFAEYARACEEPDGAADSGSVGRCADGLGHVAGKVGEPQWCATFTSVTGRQQCGNGYVMARYKPAGQEDPTPGVTFADVAAWCATWPDEADPRGCYLGAGYAFSRPYADYEAVTLQFGAATEARQARLLETYRDAVDACGELNGDTEHMCERALVAHISLPAVRYADTIAALCDATRDSLQEECRSPLSN